MSSIAHNHPTSSASPRRRRNLLVSIIAALALILPMFGMTPAAAQETDNGISFTNPFAGLPTHNGVPIVQPNTTYELGIQYPRLEDGAEVVVDVQGLVIPAGELNIEGNDALESAVYQDGQIILTFKDPIPADVQQGLLRVDFQLNQGTESVIEEVSWTVDGEGTTTDIVILYPGDEVENVQDSRAKTSTNSFPAGAVTANAQGQVSVTQTGMNHQMTYAITYANGSDSAIDGAQITDTLGDYLRYVDGSFTVEVTTWDENGLNKTTQTITDPTITFTDEGFGFSHNADIPANAIYTIRYATQIDPAQQAALEEALQTEYNNVGADGRYTVPFLNDATIAGTESSVERDFGGQIPLPDNNGVLGKGGNLGWALVEPAADGSITPPQEIDYTIAVDLTQFDADSDNAFFRLSEDVILVDTLPSGVALSADAVAVISAAGFTQAADGTSADGLVAGQFLIDGQSIHFNLGRDAEEFAITIPAVINNVGPRTWTDDDGNFWYHRENRAQLTYYTYGRGETPVNLTDTHGTDFQENNVSDDESVTDSKVFNKTSSGNVTTRPGEPAEIAYSFVVNNNAIDPVDVTTITITDQLDVYTFDPARFDSVTPRVTYNWNTGQPLAPEAYEFTISPEGELTFRLTGAFSHEDVTRRLQVDFTLTTFPFEGKDSLQIRNDASLSGTDEDVTYTNWSSSETHSYGSELEVRKTVYDRSAGRFTSNLRLDLDALEEEGEQEFIYRVELLPRGGYHGVRIIPVVDVLPEQARFVGFVAPENVGAGEPVVPGDEPYEINPGGLQAVYNEADGTVVISNRDGETLPDSMDIELNFMVAIEDWEEDIPVANVIGGTSAIITPSGGYPLKIDKVDSTYANRTINPAVDLDQLDADGLDNLVRMGGEFTITGPENFETTAFVYNGQLSVRDGDDIKLLVVPNAGEYTVTENTAPAGYITPDPVRSFTVVVDEEQGQVRDRRIANDPLPRVSVGDYVWFDANADGIQDEDEDGVEGVTLELRGPDGGPVLDVFGNPVDSTTTDAAGLYTFDNLPALEEGQHYTVIIAETSRENLIDRGWMPTLEEAGDDNTVDSNTWEAQSVLPLIADGQRDPSLDFGFREIITEGTVNKSDAAGNDANTADEAVDVGPAEGSVEIVFTIVNRGNEPMTNIGLADVTTSGSGELQYPIVLEIVDGETYSLEDADARWEDGELAPGESMTARAMMTGIEPGESHSNTVTLWADGALSGNPIQEPGNPSDDPENPNRPNDPYNAAYRTWAIGDYVWIDTNDNGIQGDEGDVPFAGEMTVRLYELDDEGERTGAAIDTTQTDENGFYLFDNLHEGTYEVEFELPGGYRWTSTGAGDVGTDSNALHEEPQQLLASTGPIVLNDDNAALEPSDDYGRGVAATQGIDPTWDAGIVRLVPTGDILKGDVDGNAADTADEAVDLGPVDGTVTIEFVITNNGEEPITQIGLEDVSTGTGEIQYPIVLQLGDGETFALVDADARWDGELAVGESLTATAQLTGVTAEEAHANEVTLHAEGALTGDPVLTPEDPEDPDSPLVPPTNEYHALYNTYAIGDYVWIDVNADGVQGEEDVVFGDGLTVHLWELDGEGNRVGDEPKLTTETDADGLYLFDDLVAGNYEVEFELPDEYRWTAPRVDGADITADSDAVFSIDNGDATASTGLIVLGESNTQLVPAADYDGLTVNANQGIDPTWDAGLVLRTYAIGDVVWIDRDRNGQQDEGEVRLPGVVVNLYAADENGEPTGEILDSHTTEADGRYLFDELPAGEYVVEFVLPEGYTFTEQNADGVTNGANSDADVETGLTTVITLGNSELTHDYDREFNATEGIDPTWDAGVLPVSVSVGDLVWFDTNRDGLQDNDEGGIEGVELILTVVQDGEETQVTNVFGDPVQPVTTDGAGFYEFTDLPPLGEGQTYRVTVNQETVPEIYLPTIPGADPEGLKDSSTDFADSIIPLDEDGARDPSLDFGFVLKVPSGTINKSDAAGNDANTAAEAVDLGPAEGQTTIVFTIVNDGDEPLTNIGLVDVSTGSGVVNYPITATTSEGQEFTLTDADSRWDGVLAIGETVTATATLTGVEAGQPHANVVTLWADGTVTGNPVQDPENPGTPENPNRPTDPYHAEYRTYAIGDVVWVDRNENGQQDDGEAPIADVTVNLYAGGEQIASTTTDAEGRYVFDGLTAGDYVVEFELPNGYKFTTQDAAGVPDAADSDADVETGRTTTISLGESSPLVDADSYDGLEFEATQGIDPTWDAGVIPHKVSVGDLVWFDIDGDGLQGEEPGIPGVVLEITGPNGPVTNVFGEPVGPTTTGENGEYSFEDLPVLEEGQSYTVTIVEVPERFKPTEPRTGEDRHEDSDTGSAESFEPLTTDGAHDPSLDFGFVLKNPGADVVKFDENGNDANTADAAADLSPTQGSTTIHFTVVNNGEEPITNIGLVDVSTGSGVVSYPITATTTDGQSFTLNSADDRWDGELGIGEAINATAALTGVVAGEPHSNVVTLWADGALTGQPVQDPSNPSDDPENPNRPEDPYHAVVKTYAIGDYVWVDTTPNDVQDGDEPGLGGVTVRLLDENGEQIASTTTAGNGYYQFDNLEPGIYQVQFDLPHGYVFVNPDQGGDDAQDSDALPIDGTNNTQGRTIQVTLDDSNERLTDREGVQATEGIDPTWDAGVRLAEVSVGDLVWKDTNRDGLQDEDEPGIPGVVLNVTRTDGRPVTDVTGSPVGPESTDENGFYSFDRLPLLPEGVSYVVTIDREASAEALGTLIPTIPGAGNDTGADSSTWEETATGLDNDGDRDPSLDFGFVEPKVSVGDRVWEDRNKDGLQDPGEPGIPGVVLEIRDPNGDPVTDVYGNPVGPVTTDENGNYRFEDLPTLPEGESYTVIIDREGSKEALEPFEPTIEGAGDDPSRDSSTWEATSGDLTNNGDEDLTLDFGFKRPSVTVGDKVWLDEDGNGRQDPGEPGIPGVVLEIRDPNGDPVTDVYGNPVGPITTDENGNYRFEDLPVLPEGESYRVVIDREASANALRDLDPTQSGVGDRAGDSSTWEAFTEGLNADGQSDLTLDFGFVPVQDPVDPEDPKEPGKPGKPGLPPTGAEGMQAPWMGFAFLLGLAGAGLLTRRLKQHS